MTSRRNFVISAGTLLTGSGAFLGSGAFEVGSGDWVSVGVRTPTSAGFGSSVGLPGQESGGGDSTDNGDGKQPDDEPGDSDGSPDRGGVDEGGADDRDRKNRAPSGETSIRLEAMESSVLGSKHVLTAEDGTLQGLRLRDVNMNALTYVGETSDGRFPNPDAGDRVAFLVVNDGDVAVDLTVDIDGAAPEVLNFPAWVDSQATGPRQRDLTAVAVESFSPGESVQVVVEVDTTDVDPVPDDAVEAVTFVADPG